MYRADNVRFVSFPDGVGPLWEAEGFSLSSRWLFLCSRNKCSNTQNPLGSKWEETSFRLAPSSRFYDQLLVMNLVSSPPRPSGGRAEKNPVASWPLPISIFCGTQTFWGGSAHLTHRQCVSVCVCVCRGVTGQIDGMPILFNASVSLLWNERQIFFFFRFGSNFQCSRGRTDSGKSIFSDRGPLSGPIYDSFKFHTSSASRKTHRRRCWNSNLLSRGNISQKWLSALRPSVTWDWQTK